MISDYRCFTPTNTYSLLGSHGMRPGMILAELKPVKMQASLTVFEPWLLQHGFEVMANRGFSLEDCRFNGLHLVF